MQFFICILLVSPFFFFFFFISQNILIKHKRGTVHNTQDVYKEKPKMEKIGEKENPKS
jgi:hypothetical protein